MRSTGSAVPIVQPVHRTWGKLSWDLSETTWISNGGTDRWQSLGRAKGVMPRAKRSPAEDRGNTVAIIERLHLAGWSIGDVPLRGERGGLV